MSVFLKNTAFHGILLDALFKAPVDVKLKLVQLMNEGIKSGAVRPLPAKLFNNNEIEQAFR